MIEIDENLQRVRDQLMILASLDVHHEAQTTGVVLELGIIQTLLRRRAKLQSLAGGRFVISGLHLFFSLPSQPAR